MDEIKNLSNSINELKIEVVREITSIPEKIFEKSDAKYASKELEGAVEKIKEKQEQRTYDWLKYAIVTTIGMIVSVVVAVAVFNINDKNKEITSDEVKALIEQNNSKYFEK